MVAAIDGTKLQPRKSESRFFIRLVPVISVIKRFKTNNFLYFDKMETLTRHCLACGKTVKGRIDKKILRRLLPQCLQQQD